MSQVGRPYHAASFAQMGVLAAWQKYGPDLEWGRGQCLALLDDGCELSDPAWRAQLPWGPKVVASWNSIDGNDDCRPVPPGYHGTSVGYPSSLNLDGVWGVAYNNHVAPIRCVSIVHLRQDESLSMARGLRWVRDHAEQFHITAVNLSPLDDQPHQEPEPTAIDGELAALRQAGIWVSAPCGNNGYTDGISWPACQPDCFAIGATVPGRREVHLDRSARVDLLVAADATSSANAFAAASAQVMREAIGKWGYPWQQDGDTLPAAILAIFRRTGVPIDEPASGRTWPELDLLAALDHVRQRSTAMEPRWFERSFRRNLVDMHIADSDPRYMRAYDPGRYVANLVRAGIDTAIVYAGNCLGLCFWPTRVGQMHRGLGGRDILREVTDECRRQDLQVVVYFNIWSRWAYDTHPEWRYVDAAGKGHLVETQGQRYGLCCPNTGYGAYVLQQVADLAEHYAMDGFWVDMIGWFAGPCFCAACRARYRDETGNEFPAHVDWLDPAFSQFQAQREAWFAGFARDIRATVHRFQPAASITFQAASWSLGWYIGVSPELFAQSDYLAGDFYGDPIEQSYVCKLLEALAAHRPVEFMTSRCPTLAEHTTMKPRELLEAQAFAATANNAAFVFIDAMNPDGTVEPAPYAVMGEILKQTRVYEAYLGPHLTRLADVGLYTDLRSLASLQDAGTPLAEASPRRIPARALQRVAGTLVRHHLAYDVVTRRQLGELGRFRVLILPDAFRLDAEEAAALRQYVAAGGRLYVSGDTSYAEGNGDFLLADVLGVRRAGRTDWEITFLSPAPGHAELSPATAGAPLELNEAMTLVEAADDAEVLAHLALPYTPPGDAQVYASAISNPPGPGTEHPALVRHAYGQGVTMYCAGRLESAPHEAHAAVFARLVRSLLDRPEQVQTDAPRAVEVMVYADAQAQCLLVCLLNFQHDLPNIPVHHIQVSVALGGRPARSVTCLPNETPVAAQIQGDRVVFGVERLDTFAMYRIA